MHVTRIRATRLNPAARFVLSRAQRVYHWQVAKYGHLAKVVVTLTDPHDNFNTDAVGTTVIRMSEVNLQRQNPNNFAIFVES
jgi:hypothetical protein